MLSQYTIAGPHGPVLLSVPLQRTSKRGWYRDVQIAYGENWQKDHWKSIEAAYGRAPFFIYYNYRFKRILDTEFRTLYELNLALFEELMLILELPEKLDLDHSSPCKYFEKKEVDIRSYPQVFEDRNGFNNSVFVLDLLFNIGPEASDYLIDNYSIEA
jgi:hypothetical protein